MIKGERKAPGQASLSVEMTKLGKQLEEQYPVVISQDVIWGDMDAFGHVNNTVYFRYFEDAHYLL